MLGEQFRKAPVGTAQMKTAPKRMSAAIPKGSRTSALAGFEARVTLVNDVDAAAAAHDAAAFFTQLGRLQRVSDFHNPILGNT